MTDRPSTQFLAHTSERGAKPGPDPAEDHAGTEPEAGTITFHWFLPTSGDSRDIIGGGHGAAQGAVAGRREPTVAYLGQIASAAEQLGFVGALTPTGSLCEDAWLSTAMLCGVTERLKFLVAFRPGFYSPTLAAQMGATFQRQSNGRLLVNVVTGGERAEQRAYGDFLDKDARYARTDEFLAIVRDLWSGKHGRLRGDNIWPSKVRRSPRRPTRSRWSTSVGPLERRWRWPPGTPTSTSPGENQPSR